MVGWTPASPFSGCEVVGWGCGILFTNLHCGACENEVNPEAVGHLGENERKISKYAVYSDDKMAQENITIDVETNSPKRKATTTEWQTCNVAQRTLCSQTNSRKDGNALWYFEIQIPGFSFSASPSSSQSSLDCWVGFAPAGLGPETQQGGRCFQAGIFFNPGTREIMVNGKVLPPSARCTQNFLQIRKKKVKTDVSTKSTHSVVVGAGVDCNNRTFFTIDGEIACVPFAQPAGFSQIDHHSIDDVAQARGDVIRMHLFSPVLHAETVVLSPRWRTFPPGDNKFKTQSTESAVVLCNSFDQRHRSSSQVFRFVSANLKKLADCSSATFIAVSNWLSCTGWSPHAGRVVIPMGRLPQYCNYPEDHVKDNTPHDKFHSLFRGPPCFAPFAWSAIFADGPEGPSSKVHREATARVLKDVSYHIMHTGGFVRLCTARGRALWMAQNATGHRSADWKLHFSIELEDIPLAWDLLGSLFIERGCEIGIKATYSHLLGGWSEKQRGREITLYIYCHDTRYTKAAPGGYLANAAMASRHQHLGLGDYTDSSNASKSKQIPADAEETKSEIDEAKLEECGFWLGPEYEKSSDFFTSLVSAAEARLRIHNVRSRGCADGDLPLGQYTSLRNEAYVKRRLRKLVHQNGAVTYGDEQSWLLSETAAAEWQMLDEWIYPRNNDGWNAAHHSCPVSIFDCRCAAASVPVQARRYFHWQELEKETTPYTKRDKQSPMNRWLE